MNQYVINDLIAEKITGEWGKEPALSATKVLRTTNFTNDGKLNLLNVVERDIDPKIIQKKKLHIGDVIIEKSGGSPAQPVGRVVFFDVNDKENYLCNNFTSILRPSSKVIPKYLFFALYYFHLTKKTLAYQNKTTGIINLQLDRYINTEKIPLPSLDEQQNIVETLNQADSLRQKRKQASDLLDEYIKSVFIEMFGDPMFNEKKYTIKTLKEACKEIFLGLTSKVDYVEKDGFPLIRAKDINRGKLSFDKVKYISKTQHMQITKNRITKKGDILVSKSGSLGTCAIVDTDKEFTTYESIITIRPDINTLNNRFLIYLLRNENFQKMMLGGQVGGTVGHLNLEMFKNMQILLPPIILQNTFANVVIEAELIKENMLAQSEELDNQFQALMQQSFRAN